MPRFNNIKSPDPNPGWFRWLPQKVQCAIILLFIIPLTVILFLTGMHCFRTGQPIVLRNNVLDAGRFFLAAAIGALLSGSIFAVMMGWAKSLTPHPSETHHRR